MAGLGKVLKEAQKMQKKMASIQEELAKTIIEVSAGGGAVKISVSGQQEVVGLKLDPEFLKEDAAVVQDTILSAIKEALTKAKALNDAEMQKAAGGFSLPGMF
jgi:nucleoid-associated protein EbfC